MWSKYNQKWVIHHHFTLTWCDYISFLFSCSSPLFFHFSVDFMAQEQISTYKQIIFIIIFVAFTPTSPAHCLVFVLWIYMCQEHHRSPPVGVVFYSSLFDCCCSVKHVCDVMEYDELWTILRSHVFDNGQREQKSCMVMLKRLFFFKYFFFLQLTATECSLAKWNEWKQARIVVILKWWISLAFVFHVNGTKIWKTSTPKMMFIVIRKFETQKPTLVQPNITMVANVCTVYTSSAHITHRSATVRAYVRDSRAPMEFHLFNVT